MEPITEIARIVVPEVVDLEVIRTTLGPSIDLEISRSDAALARVAAGIKDDETMALAVREAESLRDNGKDLLEKFREELYIPEYRRAESIREMFDPRLKRIAANMKALLAHVSDYKARKAREAALAKERAESDARRQRDEAEALVRAAEEAERRAKQAAEDEKRRKAEAEAAEARRIQADKDAAERRERAAREAAAAETARKIKEEEDARLVHAEVAQAEGNGAAKVETILDSPTPISPVLGKAEQADSLESVRLEKENARKVSDELARRETEAAAEAARKRQEADAEASRLRREADEAAASAAAQEAAAAAVTVATVTSGTTSVQRWKFDLASDGSEAGDIAAVLKLLKAIVEGRAPITYCGFDPKRPQDWRPAQIGRDLTDLKEKFRCDGILAYPQGDEQLKRRVVGGRR